GRPRCPGQGGPRRGRQVLRLHRQQKRQAGGAGRDAGPYRGGTHRNPGGVAGGGRSLPGAPRPPAVEEGPGRSARQGGRSRPMIVRRFLAVLVLVSGPAWFTLASPGGGPQKNGSAGDPPAKDKKPSLAEIAPRPGPVPQPEPAAVDGAIRRGVDFLV